MNERYLIVSYFAAAGGGLIAAAATAAAMRRPLGKAVGDLLRPLGLLLRRVLPIWLLLLVLSAFLSVSYFDCDHTTYESVIRDRPYLQQRTRMQSRRMGLAAGLGLLAYAAGLSVAMAVTRRGPGDLPGQSPGSGQT